MHSKQFNLAYLFFVTTAVAIGLGLCVRPSHPALHGVGLGLVLFWLSRGIFVLSKLLPPVARECCFLIGLPVYISSMLLLLLSMALAACHLWEYFSHG